MHTAFPERNAVGQAVFRTGYNDKPEIYVLYGYQWK